MPSEIIKLKEITFAYSGQRPVLNKLDLELQAGSRIGLVGANGCGKSTLFSLIMGLKRPSQGTIEIMGQPVSSEADFRRVRRQIGILLQNSDDQLFCPTVAEDVAFGPINLGSSRAEAAAMVDFTLELLEISHLRQRICHKLSGGEKKLVALAGILAMQPDALLLDEPTAGIHGATTGRLIEIIQNMQQPMLITSHNLDFLDQTCDHILCLDQGTIRPAEIKPHSHVHLHAGGQLPHEH